MISGANCGRLVLVAGGQEVVAAAFAPIASQRPESVVTHLGRWPGASLDPDEQTRGKRTHERENPAIFPAIVVIFTLGTVAVALATMMIVERLTRLAGTSRKRWRRGAPLVYLLAAAVCAAVLLYQHYQFLDQYRR